ncbi:30S ribosomal subunit protein S11 [Candidatus Zinderia insecticola CARI]|uniref:Small ribosomal subunit protein uS11 n=1 Tax=Zinderia insecticola (strain CARI) TaxID=871271 RepID=E0TJ25_ZINIC|nr:30S ribosomal subunit protein S11 [Candidatus Zinderia insecticola CARI]
MKKKINKKIYVVKKKNFSKKNKKKNLYFGIAHINTTYNNTIITITDKNGNTISWSSSGESGFKGSKKSTSFAAQIATKKLGKSLVERGLKILIIKIKGPGIGREVCIRTLNNLGIRIIQIQDITSVPHNGCRQSKKRRI